MNDAGRDDCERDFVGLLIGLRTARAHYALSVRRT